MRPLTDNNDFYDPEEINPIFTKSIRLQESETILSQRQLNHIKSLDWGLDMPLSYDGWHQLLNTAQAYYDLLNELDE